MIKVIGIKKFRGVREVNLTIGNIELIRNNGDRESIYIGATDNILVKCNKKVKEVHSDKDLSVFGVVDSAYVKGDMGIEGTFVNAKANKLLFDNRYSIKIDSDYDTKLDIDDEIDTLNINGVNNVVVFGQVGDMACEESLLVKGKIESTVVKNNIIIGKGE